MVWAHLNGDYEQAGEQVALKGLIDALFIETTPSRQIRSRSVGLCAGHLRLPPVEAQPATQQAAHADGRAGHAVRRAPCAFYCGGPTAAWARPTELAPARRYHRVRPVAVQDRPALSGVHSMPSRSRRCCWTSSPALDALLEHATRHALPVVIASTGHDAEAVARITQPGTPHPARQQHEFGVAVLRHLVRMAQQAPGFDIEIVENTTT